MRKNIIWGAVGATAVVAAVLFWAVGPVKGGLALGGVAAATLAAANIRHARRRNAAGPDGATAAPDRWSRLIPGLEDASTPAEVTACMERARFASSWDAARTWAGAW